MRPSMFGGRTATSRIQASTRSEVDLRAEFDQLIFGDSTHIAHGRLVLIRHMRRDADGYPTKCTCTSVKQTVEPDPDCSYCSGEGYLWSEEWIDCYSMHVNADSGMARKYLHMAPGLERTDYILFFFRYGTDIKYEDKIVEVKLDDEGDLVLPYVREAIHKPNTIKKMRSDHGRVEYIAVYCQEQDALKTDNP